MPYQPLDPTTAAPAPVLTLGAPLTKAENLSTLRFELDKLLKGRGDLDPTRLNRWINDAYKSLASVLDLERFEGSYAFATVADQPFYLLPSQVAWVKAVSLTDAQNYPQGGRELELIDEAEYRARSDTTALYPSQTNALVSSWFRYADMLVLWPTPSQTGTSLTVDIRIMPLPLVNDTDSPILPDEWTEVLLLGAKVKGLRALDEKESAALAWNDYTDEMKMRTNTKAESKSKQIASLAPVTRRSQLYRRRGL